MTDRSLAAHVAGVARFYDEWTDRFVAGFGTTLQAGFATRAERERGDAATSTAVLAERAGLRDGDHVLDVGCGVGGPALALATRFPAMRITGVTVSGVQVSRARELVLAAGQAQRVRVLRADYHALPFRSGAFDAAVLLESCGYSPSHERLFAEVVRTLRPGATVYVKDVFVRPGSLDAAARHDVERFDRTWRLAASPTFDGVAAALRAAGCEVLAASELPHVDTTPFLAAMVEPDPEGLFRLNELGREFALWSADVPLVYGEVVGRVR